jgi:hypothetical protein
VFGVKLFTDCSLAAANRPAATMPDVEYLHGFTFDCEQDAVDMWPSAVEQLTHFNG